MYFLGYKNLLYTVVVFWKKNCSPGIKFIKDDPKYFRPKPGDSRNVLLKVIEILKRMQKTLGITALIAGFVYA